MINLDKHELDIACPKCGKKTKKPIGWLNTNPQITCSGCGSVIQISADKLRAGVQSAQKAIDSFRASIKRLGK